MVFNSYTFLVFFAVVLLLHNLPLGWRVKKFNLLWASYLFYAAWNPPFVILLWISTTVDWFVARGIYSAHGPRARNAWLAVTLGFNLGFLGFFKYSEFLLQSFAGALRPLGIEYQPPELGIVLPVGISFYTFQTLSYTLDVYRRRMAPWDSPLDFALFVTFFPQLVAGPILRAADFLPQCQRQHPASATLLGWGLALMLLGLFQKVVLADGILAGFVEQVYNGTGAPDTLAAWVGTLAFAGQIFCDFAGYSTIAIGAALCLGFALPDNFRFPYAAVGFSDFWGRWHISLSTWLRDYLYIPLGGNRLGDLRTQVNLMLTMLIGGLWHGASWTFVVWGGLHGSYLVIERWLRTVAPPWPIWKRAPVQWLLGMGTFVLVCFTWVFFRARDFESAFQIAAAMLGLGTGTLGVSARDAAIAFVTVGSILTLHWVLRDTTLEDAARRVDWRVRAGALALMAGAIVMMPGQDRAFIYFQF